MKNFISQASGSLAKLNSVFQHCMEGHLGMRITAVGRDFICGEMPVDERTLQPYGLLHGGASIALAETLGSYASGLLTSDEEGTRVAGIDVGGSHVLAVRSGHVTGVCKAVSLGRSLHFWKIDIFDTQGRLSCAARLTVKISRKRTD